MYYVCAPRWLPLTVVVVVFLSFCALLPCSFSILTSTIQSVRLHLPLKALLASVESYFLLLAAVKTLLLQDAQLSYRSPNGQSMVRRLLLCLKEVSSRTYLLQWMLKLIRVRKILTTCRLLHFKLQDLDFLSVDVIYFNFAPVVLRLNWIIILFIA